MKSKMGIAPGKFYSCEWMVGDIHEVALNVGLKSLEAGQDEKEPSVFLQWLTRGSWGKAKWQKHLHQLQMQKDIRGHHRWSQSDNKGDKGNTQHPRQKPEHRQEVKWQWWNDQDQDVPMVRIKRRKWPTQTLQSWLFICPAMKNPTEWRWPSVLS